MDDFKLRVVSFINLMYNNASKSSVFLLNVKWQKYFGCSYHRQFWDINISFSCKHGCHSGKLNVFEKPYRKEEEENVQKQTLIS